MSYTKKTWENLPSTNTPVNATGMNDLETRIDTGIKDADVLRTASNTIVTNDDLNNFTAAGTYKCNTATIAASLTNNPHRTSAFKLIVMKLYDDARYAQIIVAADATSSLYIRSYTNAGWGAWNKIPTIDTGWVTPTLTENFEIYNINYNCRYRRIGDIVYVMACVVAKNSIPTTASTEDRTIFTLPSGLRPSSAISFTSRGAATNKCEAIVNKEGNVYVNFYGTSSQVSIPAGVALYINFSFALG